MLKQVYSILDTVSEIYSDTICAHNEQACLRSLTAIVNDRTTAIGMSPSDYILFHVGHFNIDTGEFTGYETPKRVCCAADYVIESYV